MDAPKLNYTFAPPKVYIGSQTTFTLTIQNPDSGSAINWQGGANGDEIDIYFPVGTNKTDLVTNLTTSISSETAGFNMTLNKTEGFYAIKSAVGTILEPGDTIVVKFESLNINGQTGDATIKFDQYIGTSESHPTQMVSKMAKELSVTAWLDPYVVGLFGESKLSWLYYGGIGVEVIGFGDGTGTKKFPADGNNPPYTGHTEVMVPSSVEAQRTYTVKAYTGDGKHAETEVTLTQNPPVITSFAGGGANAGDPPVDIKADQGFELNWYTLFQTSIVIKSNAGLVRNSPIQPLEVNPGEELTSAFTGNYSNMPEVVSYTMTALGFHTPAEAVLQYKVLPVELEYFKFLKNDNGKLSAPKLKLSPDGWSAHVGSGSITTFLTQTVYQPGGSHDVYYLGDGDTEHPQIQFFDSENTTGNSYKFTWITANLDIKKGLTLNPGGITIPASDVGSGNKTIEVSATTTYILSGVGTNGDTIVSKLKVIVGG